MWNGVTLMSSSVSLQQWCRDHHREDLIQEWNYERNNGISPDSVSHGVSIKVWWKCKKGHEWETRVSHRTGSNSGCPFCAGERPIPGENDLATVNPALCQEWNYEKNCGLKPENVLPKSEKIVWWRCDKGHEWKAPVFSRTNGVKCPYCSNRKVLSGYNDLATKYPELEKEWDYSKNDISPSMVLPGGHYRAWWIDPFGHSWNATIYQRVKGSGCPYCSGRKAIVGENDLKTQRPDLCLEWNYSKNKDLRPEMFTVFSNKKVWWKCEKGHEWESIIGARSRGNGCPICSKNHIKRGINDFATKHPELLDEWDYDKNQGVDPGTIPSTGSTKYWWKCKYGHSWQASLNSRVSGSGCRICSIRQRTSFPEQALFYYISQTYPDTQNSYTGIFENWQGSELDIFIPSEAIAIEYDGKAWHKTNTVTEKEKKKYRLCQEHGITLIRIKEEQKDSDTEVCDFVLYVRYSQYYEDLNNVIPQLKEYLNVPDDIDVIRDRDKIKALYYGILRKHSLSMEAPLLAKEWNYSRNGDLTPEMFMIGSADKVWWKCKKGHEWQAAISSRYSGIGCPICSNKKVLKGYNDLLTTNPELISEWDYQKNTVSPDEITYGFHHGVWWKCKEGHSWKTTPLIRLKGIGCPYCSNKKVLQGYNDLLTVNPILSEEWDYDKNGDLLPSMVIGHCGKKVWWRCKEGHSWQATVNHRAQGTGCPFCSGKRLLRGFNDLETQYPDLAKEWDFERNDTLLPSMVTPRSDKKVWWKCQKGHGWQASVSNRVAGTKCPICSGKRILQGFNDLATTAPELLEIWDFDKNKEITPYNVGKGSEKKVWWKCPNGHEWQAVIYTRIQRGNKCPICGKEKKGKG